MNLIIIYLFTFGNNHLIVNERKESSQLFESFYYGVLSGFGIRSKLGWMLKFIS